MRAKDRLFTYLKPMRGSLVIALFFSLLFVIAQIGQPFLLGKALDASQNDDKGLFNIMVYIALGLIILGVICGYFFEVIVMNVSQRIIKKSRDEVYKKINAISLKDIDKKRGTGAIICTGKYKLKLRDNLYSLPIEYL